MRKSAAVSKGAASIVATIALLAGCPRDAAGALLPGPAPSSETAYFLVAEREPFHHDSFVLPLSDPAHIAEARRYLEAATRPDPSRPPGIPGPIVVAKIAKGADGINGDYVEPDTRKWSWHVTEFEAFTDFTIELIDGWPGYVESDIDGWIRNTDTGDGLGQIGFWSYTLVAELPNVPEPTGPLVLAPLVMFTCLRRPRRAEGPAPAPVS